MRKIKGFYYPRYIKVSWKRTSESTVFELHYQSETPFYQDTPFDQQQGIDQHPAHQFDEE